MKITSGKLETAQKVVVYGPEGIGKSTFASQFPEPLFIDTEGSTKHMDVKRFDAPSSWTMLLQQIEYVKKTPGLCKTLVIDTADWAEQLATQHICAKANKLSIEDFGYGKGYTYLAEEFGKMLNLLNDVIDCGINVCVTAHAKMRKFEQPDEMGAYDRWELKLQKNTAPLLKEWSDMLLFATYKTFVVKDENNKAKAQGGRRTMYTQHHPCWDAKNRHGLPNEVAFSYDSIASCIAQESEVAPVQPKSDIASQPVITPSATETTKTSETTKSTEITQSPPVESPPEPNNELPKALLDLMAADNVTEDEIQLAVSLKGYYTALTPVAKYDPGFIQGVLIGAWPQVLAEIKSTRNVPF